MKPQLKVSGKKSDLATPVLVDAKAQDTALPHHEPLLPESEVRETELIVWIFAAVVTILLLVAIGVLLLKASGSSLRVPAALVRSDEKSVVEVGPSNEFNYVDDRNGFGFGYPIDWVVEKNSLNWVSVRSINEFAREAVDVLVIESFQDVGDGLDDVFVEVQKYCDTSGAFGSHRCTEFGEVSKFVAAGGDEGVSARVELVRTALASGEPVVGKEELVIYYFPFSNADARGVLFISRAEENNVIVGELAESYFLQSE